MNLSPRWVDVLSAAGIEAAHWSTLVRPMHQTHSSWPTPVPTTLWC